MSELKPCPMCGSDKIGGAINAVTCHECRLFIERPRPLQNAIDAWNRRATAIPEGFVPVAEIVNLYGDPIAFARGELRWLADIDELPIGTKLYAAPQPEPER